MKQIFVLITAVIACVTTVATANEEAHLRGKIGNNTSNLSAAKISSRNMAYVVCRTIRFETSQEVDYAESRGAFVIDGYGAVPRHCKNSNGSSCILHVCTPTGDTIKIKAYTKDGWFFQLSQRCGHSQKTLDMIDSKVVPRGFNYTQDFSWIDTNQFYERVKLGFYYKDRACHLLRFTTADEVINAQTRTQHMDIGFSGWWNTLPPSCMNRQGATCHYSICHPRNREMRRIYLWSHSKDGWNYKVEEYADDGSWKRMEFDVDSRYPSWRDMTYGNVWMDTDQFLSEATFRFAC